MAPTNELDRIRQEIGSRLREMREERGLEQLDLANQLGMSQSKISRIETGRLSPTVEDAQEMLRALKAKKSDREEILDGLGQLHTDLRTYRTLRRRGRKNIQFEISELEADTQLIRCFDNAAVPGLLQTAAYAQAIIGSRPVLHTPETVAEYVQARLARQQTLFDRSKQFEFIILEAALHYRYVNNDAMVGQSHQLRTTATLPNVRIGIVPLDTDMEVIPHSPFTIYDERLATVETPTAQITVQEPSDIQQFVESFEFFASQAEFDLETLDVFTSFV